MKEDTSKSEAHPCVGSRQASAQAGRGCAWRAALASVAFATGQKSAHWVAYQADSRHSSASQTVVRSLPQTDFPCDQIPFTFPSALLIEVFLFPSQCGSS